MAHLNRTCNAVLKLQLQCLKNVYVRFRMPRENSVIVLCCFFCLFCLAHCFCWRQSRPYIRYNFLHVRPLSQRAWCAFTCTSQRMPWNNNKQKKKKKKAATSVTTLYCIFIFYFVHENNIKWPFSEKKHYALLCGEWFDEHKYPSRVISGDSPCPEKLESDVHCINLSLWDQRRLPPVPFVYYISVTINSVVPH